LTLMSATTSPAASPPLSVKKIPAGKFNAYFV
jgi:hypothetical protein